jgi:hypothetical protein
MNRLDVSTGEDGLGDPAVDAKIGSAFPNRYRPS